MNKREKTYISLTLLAVYAFFFASTHFFYHVHTFNNITILHSHIWNGQQHNHTAAEYVAINLLDNSSYQPPSNIEAPMIGLHEVMLLLAVNINQPPVRGSHYTFSLRDPPVTLI